MPATRQIAAVLLAAALPAPALAAPAGPAGPGVEIGARVGYGFSAGQLGAQPAPAEQMLNATVSVQSRLQTPEQFAAIRLKAAADGSIVRLRDVARVEKLLREGPPQERVGVEGLPGAA